MKLKSILILSLFFCVITIKPEELVYLNVEPQKSPFSPDDLGTILMPRIQNATAGLYQFTTKDGTTVSIVPNKISNMYQVFSQMPVLSNLGSGNKIEFQSTSKTYPSATLSWQANQIKVESNSTSLNLTTVVNISELMRYITYYYQSLKGNSINLPSANLQATGKYETGKKYLFFMNKPVACSLYLKFEAASVKVYAIVLTTANPDFNNASSKYRGQSYRNWIFTKDELDKNTNSKGIITEVYNFNQS